MDANKPGHSKPGPLWDECHQVVGSAFEVLNGLGHGLHEKPYENAMVVEFGLRRIPFAQQSLSTNSSSTRKSSNGSPIMSAVRCSTTSASPGFRSG